jgi:riboflavin transporter FmnP
MTFIGIDASAVAIVVSGFALCWVAGYLGTSIKTMIAMTVNQERQNEEVGS